MGEVVPNKKTRGELRRLIKVEEDALLRLKTSQGASDMTDFNAEPKTEAEALADAMMELTQTFATILVRGAGVMPHSVADSLRDVSGSLRRKAGHPAEAVAVHMIRHRLADAIDATLPAIRKLPRG